MSKQKIVDVFRRLGFTLTELIVVITILTILATIAVMAFRGYAASARDSVRIGALKNIHQGLLLTSVKMESFPIPDNPLNIVGVGQQGYIGDNVQRLLNVGGSWKDPTDDASYIYSVNPSRKKAQVSGFLEDGSTVVFSLNTSLLPDIALAGTVNYSDRFAYTVGDSVGILLDNTTKAPVNMLVTTGSLDLASSSGVYTAVFSNSSANSGSISGSGANLLTEISIIQNACVLGNSVVQNGGQILAYNAASVAYNATCSSTTRKCLNGIFDGDATYSHDTCAPVAALNCSATSYNGYTVPTINHLANQTLTKSITGGTAQIQASCVNGVLSYGTESISCTTGYVLQGGVCVADTCPGNAPTYSISNGTQSIAGTWNHSTTPGTCTFICQAGYYWNGSACTAASLGYIVATSGSTAQTACSGNNTYQDTTGQTACKTVAAGYYSTPVGAGAKTGQTQCEANNYCVGGVKTACSAGYSSPAGSSSAGACTINTYTISGSFGSGGNGATVNVCGTNVTADTSGNFSTTRDYGSVCNTISATRTGYTCTTSTNGPASLTSNTTNIAGSCTANSCSATSKTVNGHSYSVPAITSGNSSPVTSAGVAVANGTQYYTATFGCTAGTTTVPGSDAFASVSCNLNYSVSGQNCTANSQSATCGGSYPANSSPTTATTYTQTWNGSAWTPTTSWANGAGTCGYGCNSGYTYSAGACVANGCTLPWGGSITSGNSVTAYSATSVTSPTTCGSISQTRTCTAGVLSGTYTNQTCTQLYRNCSSPCGTIAHGATCTAYASSSVTYPTTCASQVRTCNDGTMDGSYANTSCTQNYTYAWVTSGWSACSTTCGTGTQTRTQYCQRNDGTTVADAYCGTPVTSQSCTNTSSVGTGYSAWSSCSASCGGGTQTRTDACGNVYSQSCNTDPCGPPPINGVCAPYGTFCSAGIYQDAQDGDSHGNVFWDCLGINGGADTGCAGHP